MKFSDGQWQSRPGVTRHNPRGVYDVRIEQRAIVVIGPTKEVHTRRDTVDVPVLTARITAPIDNVLRVELLHHKGQATPDRFRVLDRDCGVAETDGGGGVLKSGELEASVAPGTPWEIRFTADGRHLTRSGPGAAGWADVTKLADLGQQMADAPRKKSARFMYEQLDLGVGSLVYGLGEHFGPFVKNGQAIEAWNADGGTSSEQAYKNVPFYLTNSGYGVFVNEPGHVSFEVASESVQRVQFSVRGESLEYFVIYGPSPKAILERYTALTGRPAEVPAWSYGLWLSTSFTTDYDEETVARFIDGMRERDIPLSVFHFDCLWMREFEWCDFEWDPRVSPDPQGMLARLHAKDVRVCVWINPYIAQQSRLFEEAVAGGYLLRGVDGSVWQWDKWQAGMGLVDFTNPEAVEWFQGKLQKLLDQGVDCFKTDFGERIPGSKVVYASGADPERMHNLYAQLYNRAVFEILEKARGLGNAVVFARSATAGGQQFPVHWGGDSSSTFESMAESLRGGLSLALSGFAYWSHDIGGFEGTPDPAVFKRWLPFGLLSSHSRLHGSDSYRVPWAFDAVDAAESDQSSAVSITRKFAKLKNRLAPYLVAAGREASTSGLPLMRPMVLEFPDDPATSYLDRQYLLGPDLLVVPVFSAADTVDFYLPAGDWIDLLSGHNEQGPRWVREKHGLGSLPLYVRPGAVIALGRRDDRPDTDHLDGLTLLVHPLDSIDWAREVAVIAPGGQDVAFRVHKDGKGVVIESTRSDGWGAQFPGGRRVAASEGSVRLH